MFKIWVVARNELQMTLREKQNWLLLLVLPMVIIYLAGVGAQGVARLVPATIRVDVLDEDGTSTSGALLAALRDANKTLLLCPGCGHSDEGCGLDVGTLSLSPSLARHRLLDDITFAIVRIPRDFEASLVGGQDTSVVLETRGSSAASEIVYVALESAVATIGGPILATRLSVQAAESLEIETGPSFTAARRAHVDAAFGRAPMVRMTAASDQRSQAQIMGAEVLENGFKLSTPSIVVMFVMVSILGMAQSLAEERWVGILPRIGTMPVNRAHLLGGKLLATCFLGILQFAVLLLFGGLLGANLGTAPLGALIVGTAYVLAIASLALVLGAVAQSPQQASSLATSAYMVLAPLGGAWWPLAFVPSWMRTLGHISPIAWALDALNALIFYGGTIGDVLRPSAVLLLFALACFVVGTQLFTYRPPLSKENLGSLPHI